jgi:hypothetical protein
MQLFDYFIRLFIAFWFASGIYAVVDEQRNPPVRSGGWLVLFGVGLWMFFLAYFVAHVGAEIVVDDSGLTTRHRGWRLFPINRRLRIRIPRHLPVHEIGRVEAINDYNADLGMWFGFHRGEKIKMSCSAWSVHTRKAIAVVQERPGLRRRLWLLDVDDPDPIADALIAIRDTHNPGYLLRVAMEDFQEAEGALRRARIPKPTGLDNSTLMPSPDGDATHQTPKSFPGHREVIFEELTLEALEPSPPFKSFRSAAFELTVTAVAAPTPFTELIGPAVHLIEADNDPDITVKGSDRAVIGDIELRRAPLGRPTMLRPGDGTFRLYTSQTATIHLRRRR